MKQTGVQGSATSMQLGRAHINCEDFDGCVRLFEVKDMDDPLWHAVYSEGERWSLGVRLSPLCAGALIDHAQ